MHSLPKTCSLSNFGFSGTSSLTQRDVDKVQLQRRTLSWLYYLFIGELSLRRLLRSLILIPIVTVVGLMSYGYMFSDRTIFQPPSPGYKDSEEIIKLTTSDGARISAVFLPNEIAEYTILFSHGNAEDLGTVGLRLRQLHEVGFSVLGYDYRGYGTSEGRPSESAVYKDIDAAFEYLTTQRKIPPDRIILDGWSLGGAVAADLASRRPVAGLVLESAFVSAFRVVTVVPVPFDKFNTLSKVKSVTCPILVIHGRDDNVIKFWHGKKLFDAANEPKQSFWIDNAGHGDLSLASGGGYEVALRNFVNSLLRQ
jgi:abhydrolase domain-containing protein 17